VTWISGIAIVAALVSVVVTLATMLVWRRKLDRVLSQYEEQVHRQFEARHERWSDVAAQAYERAVTTDAPDRPNAPETIAEDDALARRRVIDDSVQTLGDVAQRARRRAASHARSPRE
jgi:alpha-galactosidase